MNKKFSYDINPKKNVMRENSYTYDELKFIISIRTERTIDNASSLKYFGNYYMPLDDSTGEVMSFKSGTKCIVVNSYDNKLYGIINEKIYSMLLVEQQDNNSKNASKNGFKPSSDNPWRKFTLK